MDAITPKSLTETIGPGELRKKVEEEIGLPDLLPQKLIPRVGEYSISTFQAIIPEIEGFGVKCQDLVQYINRSSPLFRKYLANYMEVQVRINKIVRAEDTLFKLLITKMANFHEIRRKVALRPALGPSWLQYAIARPVLTSYGYIVYFIKKNAQYEVIVKNHQDILRWIYDNADDINERLTTIPAIEDFVRYIDSKASNLRRREYRAQKQSLAEIYYDYYMKNFVKSQPLNTPVLHNYMRLYETPEQKPRKSSLTKHSPPNARIPRLNKQISAANTTRRLRGRSPTTITTPAFIQREIATPRVGTRRSNLRRRIPSPITLRTTQPTLDYRPSPPSSPYVSPILYPNSNSASSDDSFVSARSR